ncbi:MAG: hypothetical protein FAZ92_03561 [Accumulibacter sp.]|nr:MAG: hypothetical protein FAZ92_03561 [Accumulibacter sp.]
MVERQVAVLQLLQIAQHLVLGMVGVEHRVRQDGVLAQQRRRQERVGTAQLLVDHGEVGIDAGDQPDQRADVGPRRLLVDGDRHCVGRQQSQVVAGVGGGRDDGGRAAGKPQAHGVEEVPAVELDPRLPQAFREQRGEAVDAAGDAAQSLWAVVDGVHAGDVGEQDLRGADVRIGLFAPDVLFAGLQRHAQRPLAARIDRDADDAAGDGALVLVTGGKERSVRAAKAERDAKALRRTERDVGAHLAGRAEQHQRHQVGGDGDDAATCLDGGDLRSEVGDLAGIVRVLEQGAEDLHLRCFGGTAEDQFEAEPGGARPQHVGGLREARCVHEEALRCRLADAARHAHRFGGRGRLVEQRSIGEFEAGEVDHHLLVIEQRLQPSLREFGLVGRIGGVPAGVLEDVAQHDRWRHAVGVAHADQRMPPVVAAGDCLQRGECLDLAARAGKRQRRRQPDRRRHRLGDQFAEAGKADGLQHAGDLAGVGADVAAGKVVALFEGRQRRRGKRGIHVLFRWFSRCLGGGNDLLVGGSVEQPIEVTYGGWPHAEQPSPIGVLVDQFGCIGECLIAFDDAARQRRVDVGRRLDRFDDGGFLFGREFAPRLGQLDEDEVTEQFLRMIGDADADRAVGFQADPFVAAGVLEVGRDVHFLS